MLADSLYPLTKANRDIVQWYVWFLNMINCLFMFSVKISHRSLTFILFAICKTINVFIQLFYFLLFYLASVGFRGLTNACIFTLIGKCNKQTSLFILQQWGCKHGALINNQHFGFERIWWRLYSHHMTLWWTVSLNETTRLVVNAACMIWMINSDKIFSVVERSYWI